MSLRLRGQPIPEHRCFDLTHVLTIAHQVGQLEQNRRRPHFDDITVEGSAMSSVPSLSFCSITSSPAELAGAEHLEAEAIAHLGLDASGELIGGESV